MKKEMLMTLAAVGMIAGLSADQPSVAPAAAPAQSTQQQSATNLSADELAFAAKLNEQNRKVFSSQFTSKQRQAAMEASQVAAASSAAGQKTAMAPNEAVAKVMKESTSPAVVEKKVAVEKKEAVQAAPAASHKAAAPQAK